MTDTGRHKNRAGAQPRADRQTLSGSGLRRHRRGVDRYRRLHPLCQGTRGKAKRLREQCGVKGRVDIEAVAHLLGLEVDYWTFAAGTEIDEITVGSCIAVADYLDEPSRRWAIAHAIGHHVMQAQSNAIWLRARTLLSDKFERQAEDFAFHLLVDMEEARVEGLTDAAQIAERYGVPIEMVHLQGRTDYITRNL